MKALYFVFFFFLSFHSRADMNCYEKILKKFTVDSVAYQIDDEDISTELESNANFASLRALRKLENKLGCMQNAFKINDIKCNELASHNPFSKVCYLEDDKGYFFISKGMLDKVMIIFNRWD